MIMDKFDNILAVKLVDLHAFIKKEYKLEVNLMQCWRAKCIVIEKMKGNANEEYSLLNRYVLELRRSNP